MLDCSPLSGVFKSGIVLHTDAIPFLVTFYFHASAVSRRYRSCSSPEAPVSKAAPGRCGGCPGMGVPFGVGRGLLQRFRGERCAFSKGQLGADACWWCAWAKITSSKVAYNGEPRSGHFGEGWGKYIGSGQVSTISTRDLT